MDDKVHVTKMQLTIALVLSLLVSVTGSTYAYFAAVSANGDTITGDAATVNLTLNVNRVYPKANSTNTGVLVPQLSTSNSATSPLANALKNGCVDGNSNVVCHVYKVNIKNQGGSANQVVNGAVSFFGNPGLTTDIATVMPSLKWRLVSSVNETTASNSVLGSNVDHVATSAGDNFVSGLTMANNSSFNYYLIVWIGETNTDQVIDEGSSFYGVIEFDASNGSGVTAVFGDTSAAIDNTQYTVTFNPNGGTVSTASKQVTVGQKYGALPTPTRSGYTFKGWHGKNLLNPNGEYAERFDGAVNRSYIEYDNNNKIYTAHINNHHHIYGYNVINYINLGDTYTYSANVVENGTGEYTHIGFDMMDNGNRVVKYSNLKTTSNQRISYTYTIPSTVTSCIVGVGNNGDEDGVKFNNLQLEKGNTATPYEPYYITTNTKVVQAKNHTLTAIWEAN